MHLDLPGRHLSTTRVQRAARSSRRAGDLSARAADHRGAARRAGERIAAFSRRRCRASASAAHALPLGVADKVFLALENAGRSSGRHACSTAQPPRSRLGSYTLRPFGSPMIDGYFGGAFARALENAADAALTAFAIEQICARSATTCA